MLFVEALVLKKTKYLLKILYKTFNYPPLTEIVFCTMPRCSYFIFFELIHKNATRSFTVTTDKYCEVFSNKPLAIKRYEYETHEQRDILKKFYKQVFEVKKQ